MRLPCQADVAAVYLERWLTAEDTDPSAAAKRLISDFSRVAARPVIHSAYEAVTEVPRISSPIFTAMQEREKLSSSFLYDFAGKHTADPSSFLR